MKKKKKSKLAIKFALPPPQNKKTKSKQNGRYDHKLTSP